ncbi:MAG: hypothetical protein U0169_20095 [Polyangiaceae bacterium]
MTNLGGFASDGAGHLYGVAVRDPNATKPVYDVVRVTVKDGTKETVAENPFTLTNGFPLDVVVWTTK